MCSPWHLFLNSFTCDFVPSPGWVILFEIYLSSHTKTTPQSPPFFKHTSKISQISLMDPFDTGLLLVFPLTTPVTKITLMVVRLRCNNDNKNVVNRRFRFLYRILLLGHFSKEISPLHWLTYIWRKINRPNWLPFSNLLDLFTSNKRHLLLLLDP